MICFVWLLTCSFENITIPCKLYQCHRGGKNCGPTRTQTQGLLLTMQALCQLSYRATSRLGCPLTFSPCLIRFAPESAQNNEETKERTLFDAHCPSREPTQSHQMSQGREKIVARPGFEPRACRLPCEHSANRDTKPLGHPLMDGWMTCDFTSFSTVFQSYQDDGQMIMKGCVQWNPVYG